MLKTLFRTANDVGPCRVFFFGRAKLQLRQLNATRYDLGPKNRSHEQFFIAYSSLECVPFQIRNKVTA